MTAEILDLTAVSASRSHQRRKLKDELASLRRQRDRVDKQLEHHKTRTRLAKLRGEDGGFQCVASDASGRNQELELYLDSDEDWQRLRASYDQMRDRIEEVENQISDIDFCQRERENESRTRLCQAIDKMAKVVATFEAAVDVFRGHSRAS